MPYRTINISTLKLRENNLIFLYRNYIHGVSHPLCELALNPTTHLKKFDSPKSLRIVTYYIFSKYKWKNQLKKTSIDIRDTILLWMTLWTLYKRFITYGARNLKVSNTNIIKAYGGDNEFKKIKMQSLSSGNEMLKMNEQESMAKFLTNWWWWLIKWRHVMKLLVS